MFLPLLIRTQRGVRTISRRAGRVVRAAAPERGRAPAKAINYLTPACGQTLESDACLMRLEMERRASVFTSFKGRNMDSTDIQHDQAAGRLPPLGPEFITGNDAAFWLHMQVSDRRDRVYGAVILKRADGRYLPTVPTAGTAGGFHFGSILNEDANLNLLAPEGYSVYALFTSRAGQAKARTAQVAHWSVAQRRLELSFFSIKGLAFVIEQRDFCPIYYLSGRHGSLIKYESSGSQEEKHFLRKLNSSRESDEFEDLIFLINVTARVGVLRVVTPNKELGGKTGQIVEPWTLNQAVSEVAQSRQAEPGTQVFRRWQDAIRSALPPLDAPTQASHFGYLLKDDAGEFVAMLPDAALKSIFDRAPPGMSLPKGRPTLSSGFSLLGIYASLARKDIPPVAAETWLAQSFFTAASLATAITLAATDEPDLEFYLRADDGALLMYRCTGSAAQAQLFANRGADIDRRLKDGTLSPSAFVRQVAAVGTLTVMETGRVWDVAGVVGPQWRAFEHIHQTLSPAFVTTDDAARHLHYWAGRLRGPFQQAFILRRHDGRFVAAKLQDGDEWRATWGPSSPTGDYLTRVELEGYRVVGQFNRPEPDQAELVANYPQFTPRQLALLVSMPGVNSVALTIHYSQLIKTLYTSGPNGTLIKYGLSVSRAELEFGEYLSNALRSGEMVPRVQGYDGTPEGLIKELVKLGELTVLLADDTWYHVQGRVPTNWTPQTPFTPAVPLDAPLSWVFTDLATAAEYAHGRLQATPGGRRVGCILQFGSEAQYVVSEPSTPIPGSKSLFALSHILGNDGPPQGFALRAWYCRSEPSADGIASEPWLYESFMATVDFAQAIASLRAAPQSNVALYVSTADGAQLAYDTSGSAEEAGLYSVLPDGSVGDNGLANELRAGTLTPHDLILKIADAGALSVLQVGTLWDVPGLVSATWHGYALAVRPQLSPAFLHEEDAARYAHAQIGGQREREYCGYILQRPDGLFVATEPLYASDAGRFALGFVYPRDSKGRSLLPSRHVWKALYGSSRGVSLMEPKQLLRPGWTRDDAYLAAQIFSADDIYTLIRNRQQVAVAYLSVAEDALLVFDLGDSPALAALRQAVTPSEQDSPVARNLANGTLTAAEWIRQLAAGGSLRVILGNPLWGAPELITEHWRPRLAGLRRDRPQQVAYGQVCTSAAEAAETLHAGMDRGAPTQTCFGVILKHREHAAFVGTELVPAWDKAGLFALNGIFAVDDAGQFLYPPGYQLHALFYGRSWMPQGLTTAERWLAQHFISPSDLSSALTHAKRQREAGAPAGLPVYISTLDQALLTVQAPLSSTLFNPIRQPSGAFEDVQTLIASGQLSAVGFVNEVAKLSWLSVRVANECWAPAGKLDVSRTPWAAFSGFMRRALSPLFSSQADAVRYACQQLGTRRDQRYGGLVLQRNGKFVATLAIPVLSEDFDPEVILPGLEVSQALLAPGWKMVGRYRSRAAQVLPFWLEAQENATYQNLFSTKTLETALKSGHLWTHEYLLTPDGSLIGFSTQDAERSLMNSTQRDEAMQLLNQLETALAPNALAAHDPYGNAVEQQVRAGRKTPTEWVNQLARVGTLQVLEGGALWGIARRVRVGWMPGVAYIAPEEILHAVADRALSPVFKHADDAARHGHAYAEQRARLSVGLILRSSDNGHFVACAPIKGDDLQFRFDRAFLRGQLPTGYSLQGLYLRLPQQAAPELPQGEGYAQLPAPAVVLEALSFLRVLTAPSERFLPLYVSCPDGSLVRFRATQLDPDWTSATRQAAYLERLKRRGSIDAYLLKLIESAEVRVLDSSPFWDGLLPRVMRVAQGLAGFDTRLALGPLCAHPDDAARLVWQRFAPRKAHPWLGAILGNGDSDTFIAVQPVADPGPSVAVGLRPQTLAYQSLFEGVMNLGYPSTSTRYPAGYKVMGVQQLYKLDTQRQRLADRYEEALAHNFIAQPEIRGFIEMLRQDRVAGARYYLTPVQGGLIVYEPSYHLDESQLLRDDWIDEATGAVKVLPSEVIRRLATSGQLSILEIDHFWQPRSQVARGLLQALKEADERS